jgi:molybdopterin-guanine dinucleotide biosynthesis protein A
MIGVVLAGGRSRRMGRDKALVDVAGTAMLDWVLKALGEVSDRVVVAGRSEGRAGYEGIGDPPGLVGPLAGILAALGLGEDILVVAVDQPWVRTETLRALAGMEGTVVPMDGGVRQVTCARYSAGITVAARSIQHLLDQVPYRSVEEQEWRTWGEDGRSWYSADDETALAEGLRRFGPPGGDLET